MEKVSFQMDLDDWELLPDENFRGEKKGKFHFDPKGVVRPFPSSHLIDIATSNDKSSGMNPVAVAVDLKPLVQNKSNEPDLPVDKYIDSGSVEADKETVSRVSFKKMKDNEFVDMKMDSPKSSSKGVVPITEAGLVKYDEKEEKYTKTTPEVIDDDDMVKESVKKETNWGDDLNINICGWKLTGAGPLCAVGAAAVVTATAICILVFGSRRGNKQHHIQKIQLEIHSEEKEKKTKQGAHPEQILNQVVSAAAATGIPFHMLFGGH